MTNLWEISDFPDFSPTSGSCNFFSTEAILKISDFSERSMSESFISAILVVWSNIWIPTHAFEKVKIRENAIHSPTTRDAGDDLTCGSSQVQGNSLPKFELCPNFNHPPSTSPLTPKTPRIRAPKPYKTKVVIEKHALGLKISRRSNFLSDTISLLPVTAYRSALNRRGCRRKCQIQIVPPPLTRG